MNKILTYHDQPMRCQENDSSRIQAQKIGQLDESTYQIAIIDHKIGFDKQSANRILSIFGDYIKSINRMKDEKQYRFTKRELILRFFAFSENVDNYEGNLTTFLNSYMYQKRNLQPDELQQKRNLFQRVTKIIWEKLRLGSNKVLSKVILEAVMVGISANLSELEAIPEKELKDRYDALLKTPELSTMNLRERIAAEEKTKQRLTVAKEIFAGR